MPGTRKCGEEAATYMKEMFEKARKPPIEEKFLQNDLNPWININDKLLFIYIFCF